MRSNRKLGVIVLIAALVVVFFTAGAYAGAKWYDATITDPGTGWGGAGPGGNTDTFFVLTHSTTGTPAFTNKRMRAMSGRNSEMLAVAMTAMSNNKKIRVFCDPQASGIPIVTNMMLLP